MLSRFSSFLPRSSLGLSIFSRFPSMPVRLVNTCEARELRVGDYFSLERGTPAEQAAIYKVLSFFVVARGRGGTSIKFKLEEIRSGRSGVEQTLGTGGKVKAYTKTDIEEIQEEMKAKKAQKLADRVESSVERLSTAQAFSSSASWNFLYFDPKSSSAHFMHPETFEQLEIPFESPEFSSVSFDESLIRALPENSQVKFRYQEGKLVQIDQGKD